MIQERMRRNGVHQQATDERAEDGLVAADAPAHRPKAVLLLAWKVAVMMASEPGTRTAPAAPCRIRRAIRNSIVSEIPHRARWRQRTPTSRSRTCAGGRSGHR